MKPRFSPLVLCAILAAVSSCAQDDQAEPQFERAGERSSLSVAATDDRLTASLERGEAFVVLEFLQGPERPPEWRRDPSVDSPHIFDTILLDRNGASLILQLGGDEFIEPQWVDLVVAPPDTSTLEERHEDILLGMELLDRLEAHAVAPDFAWEIEGLRFTLEHALRDIASSRLNDLNPEPTPDLREAIPLLAEGATLPELARPPQAAAGDGFIHQIDIKTGECCWNYAEHSAVIVTSFMPPHIWLAMVVTGNHGRLATNPSLSSAPSCPKSWSGRDYLFPKFQPFEADDDAHEGEAGGCNTSYGVLAGRHVCNDDSLAQYYNVKYDQAGNWETCSDGTLRKKAPNCSF